MAETLLAPRRPKRRLSGPKTAPPVPCPLPALARELGPSREGTWLSVARSPQGPQHRGYRSPRTPCAAVTGRAPLAQPERSRAAPRYTQVRVPGPRFLKLPPGWALRPLNLSLGSEVGAPAVRGRLVWGGQQGAWRMNQFIRFLRGIIWVAAGAGEKSQCPRPWVCPLTPANTGLRGRGSGPGPGPLLPRGP